MSAKRDYVSHRARDDSGPHARQPGSVVPGVLRSTQVVRCQPGIGSGDSENDPVSAPQDCIPRRARDD
ncbi:MAG: hypothetical protein ACOC8P_02370, partial [Dichotomicrobium sp.]